MNLSETQIQFFGLAIIFYVVLAIGFNSFFDLLVKDAKDSGKQPVMALEFVRTAGDVEKITGGNPRARDGLKTFLLFDTFAFIPLYLAFLLLMSFFMSQSSFSWTNWAATAAILAAVITALADFAENYYSYRALETVFANADESVMAIFWAAHLKWIALFTATSILSLIFWRGNWWNSATVLLLAASVGGLICLFLYRPGIVLALMLQLVVLSTVGAAFMFSSCRINFLNIR